MSEAGGGAKLPWRGSLQSGLPPRWSIRASNGYIRGLGLIAQASRYRSNVTFGCRVRHRSRLAILPQGSHSQQRWVRSHRSWGRRCALWRLRLPTPESIQVSTTRETQLSDHSSAPASVASSQRWLVVGSLAHRDDLGDQARCEPDQLAHGRCGYFGGDRLRWIARTGCRGRRACPCLWSSR